MADGNRGLYSKVVQVSTSEDKHSNFAQSSQHNHRARESWRAPRLIIFGLLGGITISLGHHFFYNQLNGKAVDSVDISQAWTLRVGNLLAFLVKICFAITVGVSLVQLQWLKFHSHSGRFNFKDVDAVSGVQMSLLAFFDSTIWLHFPSLTVIAMLYWILSVVPVITPGTLTVVTSPHATSEFMQVPKLDTYNDAIWSEMTQLSLNPTGAAGSTLLSQIVWSTAIGGQILRIPSKYMNETYIQEFVGPSAKCSPANKSISEMILTTDHLTTQDLTPSNHQSIRPAWLKFFSWVGGDDGYQNMTTQAPINLTPQIGDICRLYLMRDMNSGDTNSTPTLPDYKFTECNFYNSTYTVEFAFEDGQQSIHVMNIDTISPISTRTFTDNFNLLYTPTGNIPLASTIQLGSYLGLVEQFGSLLVGSVTKWYFHLNQTDVNSTKIELLHLDVLADVQEFDQKLEELFQNMTISLLSEPLFWNNASGSRKSRSNVCTKAGKDCDQMIQALDGDNFANVTSTLWLGTYIYDSHVLFMTYGLSFGLSLVCAAAGFYAYIRNKGSYQNVCSTFVRAIAMTEEQILDRSHDDGADPRPEVLSNAKVTFNQHPSNVEKRQQSTSYQITKKSIPSPSTTSQAYQ